MDPNVRILITKGLRFHATKLKFSEKVIFVILVLDDIVKF